MRVRIKIDCVVEVHAPDVFIDGPDVTGAIIAGLPLLFPGIKDATVEPGARYSLTKLDLFKRVSK